MYKYQRNFNIWPFYGLVSSNLYWVRVRGLGYGVAIKELLNYFQNVMVLSNLCLLGAVGDYQF